jgi:DNA-binding winged helix-turn-helix (wHTH) protein
MNRSADRQHRRDVITFSRYGFDRVNRILSCDGRELPLPPRAAAALSALLEDPGAVVTKQVLIERVWNGAFVSDAALSEAVSLLRKVFADDPQESRYIQTVHRRGYRFIAPVIYELPHVAARERHASGDAAPERFPHFRVPAGSGGSTAVHARFHRFAKSLALPCLIATIATAFILGRRTAPAASDQVSTRSVSRPGPGKALETWIPNLAVSPDGKHVVYAVGRGNDTMLFHRDLSSFSGADIPGTRGGIMPFFSSDGRRIAFLADGQLMAVPLSGGTATPLVGIKGPFGGATWGSDDTLIYAAGDPAAIYRLRPGRPVEQLTRRIQRR